jgi:hypothetical protein
MCIGSCHLSCVYCVIAKLLISVLSFFCHLIFDVSMIWSLSLCSGPKKYLSLFIFASYLVDK